MTDEMPEEIFLSKNPLNKDGLVVYLNGGQQRYVRADTRPDNAEALQQVIDSQKQTHDALIKNVRESYAAINDMAQVIDNLRKFIGRNYIAKAMPKEQEQAYDVLQKHHLTLRQETMDYLYPKKKQNDQ